MSQKLYYTTLALAFTGLNIYLLDTRFSIVGMGFGVVAAIFMIKALGSKL